MALLGLFSKKDKSKSSASTTTKSSASVADASSVADTAEYVLPDLPDSKSQNGHQYALPQPEASTSRFHLGFSRKRSTPAAEGHEKDFLRPPQMPYTTASRSEASLDSIRPPPSKATLFAAYNTPQNALSTRSLPDHADSHARTPHDTIDNSKRANADISPSPKKGLFSWAHRERKKSKTTEEPPKLNVDLSSDSFNLKSFRHVGPIGSDSPGSATTSPDLTLLPPARPRPRGDSFASDSSQRISVAAFREAAARKSQVNLDHSGSSPVLLRPPSRTDSLQNASFRTSAVSANRSPTSVPRPSTLALSNETSSEESESESEESEGSSTMRPKRSNTIRGARKGTSEYGHRKVSPVAPRPPSKSVSGHGSELERDRALLDPRQLGPERSSPRPSPKNANSPNTFAKGKAVARNPDSDDDSDSSQDSDDAPLAALVRPPRPGSSASNASGSRPRMPPKPLIDISQMNTPPKLMRNHVDEITSSVLPQHQPPPPLPVKDRSASPVISERSNPYRPTHPDKPSLSDRLARIAQSAASRSTENLAGAPPLERRSLDLRPIVSDLAVRAHVPHPTRSQTAPLDAFETSRPQPSLSMPAVTQPKPKANRRSLSSPNAAAAYDLTDPTPIVPTPIRERSPPPAFSVTSRPASQLSMNNPRLSQVTVRMVGSNSSASSSSPTSPNFPSHISSPASADSSKPDFFSSTTPVSTDPPSSRNLTLSTPSAFSPTSPPSSSSSRTATNAPSTLTGPTRPEIGQRKRSSTLVADAAGPSMAGFTGGGLLASPAATPSDPKKSSAAVRSRNRSSTLLPRMDVTPITPVSSTASSRPQPSSSSSASSQVSSAKQLHPQVQPANRFPQRQRRAFDTPPSNASLSQQINAPPPKPFASAPRQYSPASSTGDSSSGRTPLTPADSSDYGVSDARSALSSALGPRKGHKPRVSVSFEDEKDKLPRGGTKSDDSVEERRRERRRSEAKAAIELGKIVNGKVELDDDEDMPLNAMGSRISAANPMMNFIPPTPMGWPASPSMPMMSPQQFIPPPSDPRMLAAHQHAMMVAKQAYQMAVAQQAMAAANDEWERGSSTSAFTSPMGMSSMGMGMPMGMGMGMGMGVNGMGMLPGGYGMNYPMFANSAQSMYAGSVIGSELGAAWGTKSEYGGPSRTSRTSAMYGDRSGGLSYNLNQRSSTYNQLAVPSSAASEAPRRPAIRPRTKTAPSDSSLPAQHARSRPPPPSSWKP